MYITSKQICKYLVSINRILSYNKPHATDILRVNKDKKFSIMILVKFCFIYDTFGLKLFWIIILLVITTFAIILLALNVDKNH